MSVDPDERPHVFISPPLTFLLALLTGFALRAVFGGRSPLPDLIGEGVGLTLILMALWLFLGSIVLYAEAGEELKPSTPSREFIRTGPFRYSRNPIYLAMMLFGAGFGLATGNLWMLLTSAITGVVIHFFVILPEEKYLASRFGAEYSAYRHAVRRWI